MQGRAGEEGRGEERGERGEGGEVRGRERGECGGLGVGGEGLRKVKRIVRRGGAEEGKYEGRESYAVTSLLRLVFQAFPLVSKIKANPQF